MQFFGHRKATVGAVEVVNPVADADLKAAYECGRRDERSRRRGHPVIALAVSTVAVIGAGIIGIAASYGSFTGGGQVIDRQLSIAAGQAEMASRDAAIATGEAVRDAGDTLRARTLNRNG